MSTTKGIQATTILQRVETHFLVSPMGNETVMMNTDNGDYLGLNTVATAVWDQLATPTKYEDLINYLLSEYEVDKAQCEIEVAKLLQDMQGKKMLQIHESA